MKTIEIRQREEYLAPECLEATTGIAGAVAQDRIAYCVGNARLEFLESAVLASNSLTGDKTDALAAVFDRRDEARQERWVVLTITVERRHDGSPRGTDPAADRS